MENLWNKIIESIVLEPRDFHTVPITNKKILWFFVESDGNRIYLHNAKKMEPSAKLSSPRTLTYIEFLKIFPIYIRRCKGESVSKEATKATNSQIYWYGIFADILEQKDLVI